MENKRSLQSNRLVSEQPEDKSKILNGDQLNKTDGPQKTSDKELEKPKETYQDKYEKNERRTKGLLALALGVGALGAGAIGSKLTYDRFNIPKKDPNVIPKRVRNWNEFGKEQK